MGDPSILTVGLFGGFGIGNAGNDESARVAARMLRERCRVEVVAITFRAGRADSELDFPARTFSSASTAEPGNHAVQYARKLRDKCQEFLRLTRLVGDFDAVIVPGTGLLEAPKQTYPGGDIIWLGMLSLACLIRRTPLAWLAIGGSSYRSRVPALACALAGRAVRWRSYRDDLTRASLSLAHLDTENDPVVSDVVLAREPIRRPGGVIQETDQVAIAPIDYPVDEANGSLGYLEKLGALVHEFVSQGKQVSILCADDQDVLVADDLIARLDPGDKSAVTVAEGTSFDAVVAGLAGVDLVVASRYHVLIASVLTRVPCIALSHAEKDDEIMRELAASDRSFPIEDFAVVEVVAAAKRLRQDLDKVVAEMDEFHARSAAAVKSEVDKIVAEVLRVTTHNAEVINRKGEV